DAPAGRGPADLRTEAEVARFIAEPDPRAYCAEGRHGAGRHRWTVRLGAAELTRRVASHHPAVGRVIALEPVARGVSGRIRELRIRGERGQAIVVGDLKIRRLLGGLKSSLFVVSREGPAARPAAFVVRGAGFGHGVGMCQVGAIGMAEKRKSVGAILGHYFPGAVLRALS